MKTVTLNEFEQNPALYVYSAFNGEYTRIADHSTGNNAVLVDEVYWTMLNEAFKLCVDHPEWTQKQ